MVKKVLTWTIILTFLTSNFPLNCLYAQPSQPLEKGKTFIAIVELENKGGLTDSECSLLCDSLREQFFKTGLYRVIDRKNVDQVIKEQGFQLSDCSSESCAVQVGRLLGVEKIAIGSSGRLGDEYLLSVQMVNVETGEIEKIASRRSPGPISELAYLMAEIAYEIAGVPYTQSVSKATELKKNKPWYKKAWVWILLLCLAGGGGAYATYTLTNGGNNKGEVVYTW